MKQENKILISKLERKVVNEDGFITVKTEEVNGYNYAFYLKKDRATEKHFYSRRPKCKFDTSFSEGNYTAIFFYKEEGKEKTIHELEFYIDKNKNTIYSKKQTIVDLEGYKIDYYNIKSEKTFVVFNEAGSLKNHLPFGLNYLIKNGFNVIACLQNNNQYQELSFEDFKYYVKPLVENHDTYLYGTSLGGYCSIYYAGAINGTVIAGAPRNSSHPLLVENLKDKSYFGLQEFKHKNYNENPKTTKNLYIFYDPYEVNDNFFVNNFLKNTFSNLVIIECNYSGHEVLRHLNETKQLHQAIISIVKGLHPQINSNESSYTCMGKAKYYLSKKQYKKSLTYSNEALDRKTLNDRLTKRVLIFKEQALKNICT